MKQYLLQTRYEDGTVFASVENEFRIINAFGFTDCTGYEHEVFAVDEFGKVEKLTHEPATSAPFNFHRFLNGKGEVEFEGYSTEH